MTLQLYLASGQGWLLKGGSYVVGAGLEDNIQLSEKGVAPQHCVFYLSANKWWVKDGGSRNGTLVNGVPLESRGSHQLRSGDVIALGSQGPRLWPLFEGEEFRPEMVQAAAQVQSAQPSLPPPAPGVRGVDSRGIQRRAGSAPAPALQARTTPEPDKGYQPPSDPGLELRTEIRELTQRLAFVQGSTASLRVAAEREGFWLMILGGLGLVWVAGFAVALALGFGAEGEAGLWSVGIGVLGGGVGIAAALTALRAVSRLLIGLEAERIEKEAVRLRQALRQVSSHSFNDLYDLVTARLQWSPQQNGSGQIIAAAVPLTLMALVGGGAFFILPGGRGPILALLWLAGAAFMLWEGGTRLARRSVSQAFIFVTLDVTNPWLSALSRATKAWEGSQNFSSQELAALQIHRRNVGAKLLLLNTLVLVTLPFVTYGVMNTLISFFPDAGVVRFAGIRFNPILWGIVCLLVWGGFAQLSQYVGLGLRRAINEEMATSGYSMAHRKEGLRYEILGPEALAELASRRRFALALAIVVLLLEAALNIAYFLETRGWEQLPVAMGIALIPTLVLAVEAWQHGQATYQKDIIASADKQLSGFSAWLGSFGRR